MKTVTRVDTENRSSMINGQGYSGEHKSLTRTWLSVPHNYIPINSASARRNKTEHLQSHIKQTALTSSTCVHLTNFRVNEFQELISPFRQRPS
jgi:hypothetical protein